MTDDTTTNDAFTKALEQAARIEANWPAWKRGWLEGSARPTLDTPREVITHGTD